VIVPVTLAGEGYVDVLVLERLADELALPHGTQYDCGGKPALRRRLPGFNAAAARSPWVVLADLDQEPCAAEHVHELLPQPERFMVLRLAVRAVEAWLMADAEALAVWLRVTPARVPGAPDQLVHTKQALVDIARSSGSSALRQDMVPRAGSGRAVGPAYSSRIAQFVTDHWDPQRAAGSSDSLRRAMARIRALAAGGRYDAR